MKILVHWDTDDEQVESEVEVPDHLAKANDAEAISDWLSDEYGFCHYGWTEVKETA